MDALQLSLHVPHPCTDTGEGFLHARPAGVDGVLKQWWCQDQKSVMSFQICDVKYMYFYQFYKNNYMISTCVHKISPKPMWSIYHTPLKRGFATVYVGLHHGITETGDTTTDCLSGCASVAVAGYESRYPIP